MADKKAASGEKALYCSFCGKSQHEVKKLIAGPSVFICDECIDLCNDIIRDELPSGELAKDAKSEKGSTAPEKLPRKVYEEELVKLRQVEVLQSQGKSVAAACKEAGLTEQSYYRYRKEYGDLNVEQVRKLKQLKLENGRLKKLVAEQALDMDMLKEMHLELKCLRLGMSQKVRLNLEEFAVSTWEWHQLSIEMFQATECKYSNDNLRYVLIVVLVVAVCHSNLAPRARQHILPPLNSPRHSPLQ
mgnify:CR=1 FL=1